MILEDGKGSWNFVEVVLLFIVIIVVVVLIVREF
jgi:hypothetical protein